jgi:hypothetical protein
MHQAYNPTAGLTIQKAPLRAVELRQRMAANLTIDDSEYALRDLLEIRRSQPKSWVAVGLCADGKFRVTRVTIATSQSPERRIACKGKRGRSYSRDAIYYEPFVKLTTVMAGLVLDIFVAFLVRWIVIYRRKARSHRWPNVTGTVVRCHLEKPGYGCMYAVLRYKYRMNFERNQGLIKKPYIYENYAEAYTRRFRRTVN